jgi:hypothetical protein
MIPQNLPQIATQILAKVLSSGQQPIAFLMSQATALSISEQFLVIYKRRLSLAGRFWFWLTKRNVPPRLDTLCGLPVMISPVMMDGGIILQSVPQGVPQANSPRPGPPAEFVKKEPVEPPTEPETPSLGDLAQGSNGVPSVSDILIKALENVEDLKQVVVIRVHQNNDVDLSLNCNQFEASGVLQRAMQWLMMRGY